MCTAALSRGACDLRPCRQLRGCWEAHRRCVPHGPPRDLAAPFGGLRSTQLSPRSRAPGRPSG
eukprot:8278627-Pyramimonas_sp.AAC.1